MRKLIILCRHPLTWWNNNSPYPWLRELTERSQPDRQDDRQFTAHLAAIRQQLAPVQGQLKASALPATGQLGNAQP